MMMMMEKDRDHVECSISDSDLFTPPFVQTDILSGDYEEVYPITKLEDNGPIEFLIENKTDKLIDLVNCYLKLKCKITKVDGTNVKDSDKVCIINYPIASLFNQTVVYLNGTLISSSRNTHAFRSVFESLLNYGEDAKKTQLSMGLFAKDTTEHMDEADPTKGNEGLAERFTYCEKSKQFELSGKIHADIFNQGRLLINGLPLKLVMHRNKDAFVLMAAGANPRFRIVINSAVFLVRKVQLTPHKFLEIQRTLEKTPVVYPINRAIVKTHSIASGLTSLNWDNVILGQLPNRLYLAMVDNDSFTGSFKKNPFNFKHFDVTNINVYVNGKNVSQNMKFNFEQGEYIEGYRSLFSGAGKINRDEGIYITRKEYPNGYSLFGFDISPALCIGGHHEPTKEGSLRITLEFAAGLPNTITVLLYAEFDNTIKVNKTRSILKDY
jgi:hypothetical protein